MDDDNDLGMEFADRIFDQCFENETVPTPMDVNSEQTYQVPPIKEFLMPCPFPDCTELPNMHWTDLLPEALDQIMLDKECEDPDKDNKDQQEDKAADGKGENSLWFPF
jgi:hypothetical protein